MNPPALPTVLVVGQASGTVTALQAAGNEVARCSGPQGGACPLVSGGECALVESAAGIVFELDLDDAHHREILRCYRDNKGPQFPIRVVADAELRARHAEALAGVRTTDAMTDAEIAVFTDRVALAHMARRALTELVGGASGEVQTTPGRSPRVWNV